MALLVDQEVEKARILRDEAFADDPYFESQERDQELKECVEGKGYQSAMEAVCMEMAKYNNLDDFAQDAGFKSAKDYMCKFYSNSDDMDSDFWKQIVLEVCA